MRMSLTQMDLEESCVLSIEAKNLDKVKQFLSSGFSVNSFLRTRNRVWDTNCCTILAIAAFFGAQNIVEFLIHKNAQINKMDLINSRTALHWGVHSRNPDIVRMLIEAGANVNALDRDSVSPLILAANNGDLSIVQLLIQKGARVTQTDRMNSSALHYACMRLHTAIVRELIVHGCVINSRTPYSNNSPLKYLIGKQFGTACLLIEAGYDLREEKWLWEESTTSALMETEAGEYFLTWLRCHVGSPMTLRSLARLTVRRHLGAQLLETKVKLLNVPKYLKEFLLMSF